MAYNANGLRVEFGTGSTGASTGTDKFFRMASYITEDAPAVVEAANYFNGAAKRLHKNTVICAVMTSGGTPVLKQYVVASNDGTTVAVAPQTTTAG